MFELLTRSMPYEGLAAWKLVEKVPAGLRPDIPPNPALLPQFVNLMKRCWAGEPIRRPRFVEITEELVNCIQQS
jgi:hypothetical protein